jgi:hypothetical protein
MRKFKKVHIGLLFILTILVLYLFVGLPGWDYWNVRRITYSDRVHITRRNMDSARYYMDLFKRVNNRYPSSLSELERFAVDNYQPVNRLTFSANYVDLISDPNGNRRVHTELNGTGGWYFEPNTGELRLNLTKPVKYYLKSYPGAEMNDIPVTW